MKLNSISCLAAVLLAVLSSHATAVRACEKDGDCKNGNLCMGGGCVPAADSAAAATPATKLPEFCCTTGAGRLGLHPNPNPTTGKAIHEGEACYAKTATGRSTYGKACF